ncbi:MAG: hypothetical protein VXY28_06530 [Bacteroidota bacterium]|nr:hypothetical protein [Bacteroidota bacterium]
MTFDEKFYVISSTSYIKNVPQTLCTEFLKELKNDDDTLKPHISNLETNLISYGFPAIKCTIPTCFIEIVYKHDGDTYLITHEVFLYEEDYPTFADLVAYKEKLAYGFASQVTQETKDIVEAFHNGYGCECLSSGDY